MATQTLLGTLVPGKTYRLRYKMQSGNYRWYEHRMTAQFLWLQTDFDGVQTPTFSLRPLAGTQEFSRHMPLISAELVEDDLRQLPLRYGPTEAPDGL